MQIEEKLQSMVNKFWMYHTRHHKLLSFKIKEGQVILVTDRDWIEIPLKRINQTLVEFLPVVEDKHSNLSVILFEGNGKASLKDLIYENIEKIKANPEYIKSAKALNEQVKTVIEMAKLELQIKNIK